MSNIACHCGVDRWVRVNYIDPHHVLRFWPPSIVSVHEHIEMTCGNCGDLYVIPVRGTTIVVTSVDGETKQQA